MIGRCRVLNRLFQIRERSVPWFTPLFQKSRLVGFLSEPDYQLHRGKQAFLHAGRLTCWVRWIDLRVSSVMFERIQLLVYTRLMSEVMFPVRMSSSPANSCLLFLSPTQVVPPHSFHFMTLMMIWYLFLWPSCLGLPPSFTITTLRPVFLTPLWEVGGSLLFSLVRLSSPFVFGLGDVPRRTRLPLKILVYSRLLDLPWHEPLSFVFGQQPQLQLIQPSLMV